jgi:ADP-ribose diphosphatase
VTETPPADPYTRLEKRQVYGNRWLAVEHHTILHPNGHPGEHVLIRGAASSGVIVIDGADVLLVAQPRFAARREMTEIVKGGGEAGEDAFAAAQRELREELGFEADDWFPLGQAWELPSLMETPITLFGARTLRAVQAQPEEVESLRLVRMPFVHAVKLALLGGLDDAVTALTILRCERYLQGEST